MITLNDVNELLVSKDVVAASELMHNYIVEQSRIRYEKILDEEPLNNEELTCGTDLENFVTRMIFMELIEFMEEKKKFHTELIDLKSQLAELKAKV